MTTDSSYIVRKDLAKERIWQNKGPKIGRLDIELTERCNNNCIHCYINQPENDPLCRQREMTTAEVKNILEQAASLGCMTVRFTGGEPLLRPDFQELYLHTRRLGIKVILFTNATLVTSELAALFQKYPPGEPVEITVYGMSRTSYEAVSRVRGSYEAAMGGIRLLAESNIPMVIKSIRLAGREDESEEFAAFAQKYSVRGRAGGISMDFNLRARRDSEAANSRIRSLRATPQETLAVLSRDSNAYIDGQKQFAAKFMRPGGSKLFTCGCGKGGAVDAYGMYQPCLLLRHPEMIYDLGTGTLADGLERFFPEKLKVHAASPDYLRRCAECFLKGLCNQCPAWAYMENGSLDSPVQYLCDVAHEQARYLGLIGPEEKAWQVKEWRQRIEDFVDGKGSACGHKQKQKES